MKTNKTFIAIYLIGLLVLTLIFFHTFFIDPFYWFIPYIAIPLGLSLLLHLILIKEPSKLYNKTESYFLILGLPCLLLSLGGVSIIPIFIGILIWIISIVVGIICVCKYFLKSRVAPNSNV